MNAVPAKVAGVGRIVMVVPALKGAVNPLVLAAAELAGVSEIYRVGGAQAIAALAYGTPSIRPVVKIVGPGNAYVAAAKRQVFGQVGIDMVAGPSEVVVIADADNDPAWIAADLLAQAEQPGLDLDHLVVDRLVPVAQHGRVLTIHVGYAAHLVAVNVTQILTGQYPADVSLCHS
jgi:histidinol dehydrogenase